MLIRPADPSELPRARRAGRGRRVRRWTACAIVVFSFVASVVTAISYPSAVRAHELALRLEDDGVTVPAETVEARVRGRAPTQVRATFEAAGRTVTARLVEAEPWGDDHTGGWTPLTADDAPAWPLEVRYLRDRPTEAMAAADVASWTDPRSVTDVVRLGLIALIPTALAVLGWFVAGRPAWLRYFQKDGGTCWYCAHPKGAHRKDAHVLADGATTAGVRAAPGREASAPPCTPPRSRFARGDRPPPSCPCPGWVDRRQHVAVGDDTLHLWRGPRFVTIPRETITAIRGDSTNLSWSSHLIIEAGGRTLSLPVHAGWQVEDVPALREWAGRVDADVPGR